MGSLLYPVARGRQVFLLPAMVFLVLLASCAHRETEPEISRIRAEGVAAPRAAERAHVVRAPHGAERQDEYYWLRDDERKNPEMLAYLNAENTYADQVLRPIQDLKTHLYGELVGRIKQDDSTVPHFDNGYWYNTRYESGREYPIHVRRRGSQDAAEEILLDVNRIAEGKSFCQVGRHSVSPDNRLMAWFEDTSGRRQYRLRVTDLSTGQLLPVEISGLSTSIAWTADSKSFFYIENDPQTLLSSRVRRHILGSSTPDPLIYEEKDNTYYMSLGRSTSREFIFINLRSTVSSETRICSANDPREFSVLVPRERDFEYSADHLGNRWVIRTNWQARNFRLMQAAASEVTNREAWKDIISHSDEVYIAGFALLQDFIGVSERSGGLTRLHLVPNDGPSKYVAADESAYVMELGTNADPTSAWLRYVYTSPTTPPSTYEVEVSTGERRLLKETPVLGGFKKQNYVTERLWATARDGEKIPVTVLYRKEFKRDGRAAMLVHGYGSYGSSTDPDFDGNALSLVDRGMVYAIAHIRGGQEMGRRWYEDGKLLRKMNTFTDFIDVTDFLVKENFAAPDRVAAMGGSAGGLLVGAVANLAPEKYRVIVSQVPFVDVVTTMLDATIPLTTNEYDEWGNPENPTYYDYMLAYSPYDQLRARNYPAMYVGTGLWDSQVQYWEPAKYVARLRALKTDQNPLVFRVNMEAGHGGRSGRFQRYHETAEYFAFVLDQLGVASGL